MTCVKFSDGFSRGIICLAPPEVDHDPSWDLRTRTGREAEVLAQIREHGGFDIGWAVGNQKRACAIARLEASGRIVRTDDGRRFMWCTYEVARKRERRTCSEVPPTGRLQDR